MYYLDCNTNQCNVENCTLQFQGIYRILESIYHIYPSDDWLFRDIESIVIRSTLINHPEESIARFKQDNIIKEIGAFCSRLLHVAKALQYFLDDSKGHTRELQYGIDSLLCLGILQSMYPCIIKAYLYTLYDEDTLASSHVYKSLGVEQR